VHHGDTAGSDTAGIDTAGSAGGNRSGSVPATPAVVHAVVSLPPAGVDVARRRARRAAARRRRRALALGVIAAGLTCGLALPLTSLAGSPASASARPLPVVAGETVYVVRPGDTLWSIAARFDRGGSPRPMAEALARETGSQVVVPGERIPIP